MRVLCFGDSNTYGYAPYDGRYAADVRWCGRLAQQLGAGWELIEAGRNGRMICDADPLWPELDASRVIARYLERYAPLQAIIIMLGSNDALFKTAPDIAADMRELLLTVQRLSPARILLLAPPPGRMMNQAVLRALAPLYEQLAARLGCAFADCGGWNIELAEDGGHFSAAGHARFADCLEPLLRELCRGCPEPAPRK